jgi:hypothetical protein
VNWLKIEAPRPRVGFDVERLAPAVKLNAVWVKEIRRKKGEFARYLCPMMRRWKGNRADVGLPACPRL